MTGAVVEPGLFVVSALSVSATGPRPVPRGAAQRGHLAPGTPPLVWTATVSRVVGQDTLTRVLTQRGGGETPEGLAEPPCTYNDNIKWGVVEVINLPAY